MSTGPKKRRLARALLTIRGYAQSRVATFLRSTSSMAIKYEQNAEALLPEDILIQIILNLDLRDVLSASKVSSQQNLNTYKELTSLPGRSAATSTKRPKLLWYGSTLRLKLRGPMAFSF